MKYWLVVLTFFSSLSLASVIPKQPHIYVEGEAEVKVRPDIITLTIELSHTDLSAEIAKKEVDQKSRLLLSKLNTLEISAKDIKAKPMRFNEEYDYRDGSRRLRGINVQRSVEFILRDVDRYYQVNQALAASKISSLISAQASLSDKKAAMQRVKMAALKDAKNKAAEMAALTGKELADIYSISEFKTRQNESFLLTPSHHVYEGARLEKMAFADSGNGNIFTISDMTLTATIYLVYTLK